MPYSRPLSLQADPRASLEFSGFSPINQKSSDATSAASGSQRSDCFSSGPIFTPNIEDLEAPPARQRTAQACDKCRDRKTKCSGDHPVCKRCTARGLICHYSGQERVRGPTKARLRHAASTISLDLRFGIEMEAESPIKKEDFTYSFNDYPNVPQPQYQPLGSPAPRRNPYSASPGLDFVTVAPPSARMSYPQAAHTKQFYPVPPHLEQHYVRRVQSQSALMPSGMASRAMSRSSVVYNGPSMPPSRRVGPVSVVEFDMRLPNGGQIYRDDDGGESSGSEPASATASVFGGETISHSSESSESTSSEPRSHSASEIDFRLLNQMAQYRQRLSMLEINSEKPWESYHAHGGAHPVGFHSPAASINSLADVPSHTAAFWNQWADRDQYENVTVREVKLMCPSPVTPISLGGGGAFGGYTAER
ncbi:hypothetical protein B0H11DRAFT_1234008 [Mycena galericulata]|nr:hypothetical protein B0H11DRAFT_1234008 [Mycena galericulata]